MDNLLNYLLDHLPEATIGSMAFLNLIVVVIYERRLHAMKQEGTRMTGSIRAAHVRTLLCDSISETLDRMMEDDKITVEERLYWCQKFASLGLADLRHKPNTTQLKHQLRNKRIEEGKPTTLAEAQPANVIQMVEELKKRLAV